MATPSSSGRLLLLALFLLSFGGQAEPITPLLSPVALGHLRAQLWQTPTSPKRVTLLLLLSNDLLARHDDQDTPLDSVASYGQQALALSEKLGFTDGRINSRYTLGWFRARSGADMLGRALVRQGLALSQQLGRRPQVAFGWFYLGECYARDAASLPTKIAAYQRARALFRELQDKPNEAYLLQCLGDMHLLQGHPEQAIPELLEVLRIYRSAGHRQLHYTYGLISLCYRQLGDYKEAMRYSLDALEGLQATADTSGIAAYYDRLAFFSLELKQYPAAQRYLQRSLAGYQLRRVPELVVSAAGGMSIALQAQGKGPEALRFFTRTTQPYVGSSPRLTALIAKFLGGLHAKQGHYALSERYYAQMLAYLATNEAEEKMTTYQGVGKLYLLSGRYHEARRYLQEALELNRRAGIVPKVAEMHRLLFKVDSAQGHFPAAIAHYQRYKLLTDSIFNEKKEKQLVSLQIQYDIRKKEQSITLLTKQSQVQQARIRQQQWQRNTVLGGALLLALLLGLSYNRYRLKQRSNQRLEAQQQEINHKNETLELLVGEKQGLLDEKQTLLEEKEALLSEKDWMLKEIHHRVKNNLQVISSLLSTQADCLRDPAALAALRESQNRVQAMALVHQKLYQSESVALVNMQEYIQEITERLLESFDCLDTVHEQLAIAPVKLEVALATPLGLILNEAITNTLKHAFPPGRRGTLSIRLQSSGPHAYELRIGDDGVGLPPDFDLNRSYSLGLNMIVGLSKQLNGVLNITQQGPGTQLTLHFETTRKQVRAASVLM
jgi:two-component sensor histidine kinase